MARHASAPPSISAASSTRATSSTRSIIVGRTCGQCFGGRLRQLQPGDGPGDVERGQAHDGDPGSVGRHDVERDRTVGHRRHDEQVRDVTVQNGTARAGEYGAAAVPVGPHRRRRRIAVVGAGNRERSDLFSAEQSLEQPATLLLVAGAKHRLDRECRGCQAEPASAPGRVRRTRWRSRPTCRPLRRTRAGRAVRAAPARCTGVATALRRGRRLRAPAASGAASRRKPLSEARKSSCSVL